MDEFLLSYLNRFETWHKEGRVSYSSQVIPVGTSLGGKQWILPSEQAREILQNARIIGLQKCHCRQHYSQCEKPREVCLVLNDMAETLIKKGIARGISLSEALEVLKEGDIHGLVHLSLFMPDHQIFAICSCCPCCCHDLQLVLKYHHREMLIHADYVAVADQEKCTDCLACVDRCAFSARNAELQTLKYDPDACVGCGLCISVCPPQAIVLTRRIPASEQVSGSF